MTYTRRGSKEPATPVPSDPGILPVHLISVAGGAEINVPVDVPWDGCRLAHAYIVCVEAADTLAAVEIDLELDTAGGTEIMTLTQAAATADTVGTKTDGTFTDESAGRHLDSSNTIMCELAGGSSATAGAWNLYLYFEPDTY